MTKAKRGRGVTQVIVEWLPSKLEALSSNPATTKKKFYLGARYISLRFLYVN
jgi:hypothetical protein